LKTTNALREFILKENRISQDLVYVIENKNRWSFPIQVDQDPTVTAALQELLGNDRLVKLLEDLCGPDHAVSEFTLITAGEGAAVQYWHQDGRLQSHAFHCLTALSAQFFPKEAVSSTAATLFLLLVGLFLFKHNCTNGSHERLSGHTHVQCDRF